MTRNAAAFRSPLDSFVDALESIATPSSPITVKDEKRHSTSADQRWNQVMLRNAVRSLQSETADGASRERTSSRALQRGKEAPASESTLSYERALRLLARVDLDPADLELTANSALDNSNPVSAEPRKPAVKARRSVAADDLSNPINREVLIQPSNDRLNQDGLRDSSPRSAEPDRSTKHKNARAGRTAPTATHPGKAARPSSKKSVSNADTQASKKNQENKRVSVIAARKSGESVRIESTHRASLARLNTPQQRRTVVSLRLTDEELEQLRLRAEESGINVSAYVRSCVMEAENLRSQVRHVMAEIRALGAASLIQRHALPPTTRQKANNKESWMQSLRKTASRLGPLPFGLFRRTF